MKIKGNLFFAGDKSLSHRAAIIAGLAKGKSLIRNYLPGGDTLNTLGLFEKLGCRVERDGTTVLLDSPGVESWNTDPGTADLGNSGTIARLALGFLAGKKGLTITLTGDQSLSKRPMGRILRPMISAGAEYSHKGEMDRLPVVIHGKKLLPIFHKENLGSAQVKSALVFASLVSQTPLQMEEAKLSRDHTENMLSSAGVQIDIHKLDSGRLLEMEPPFTVNPIEYDIWGDISSAAFFIVLGLLMKKGELLIRDVLLNPFRTQFLEVLKKMGARMEIMEKELRGGEKGCDLRVLPSELKGYKISPAEIPSVIDELPILAIAGIFCEGEFSFRGAKELRVKESDRIDALVKNLRALGMEVEEYDDGLAFLGNPERTLAGSIESFHDHRIVMSFEIARIVSSQNSGKEPDSLDAILNDPEFRISGQEWTTTSFPDFYEKIRSVLDFTEKL